MNRIDLYNDIIIKFGCDYENTYSDSVDNVIYNSYLHPILIQIIVKLNHKEDILEIVTKYPSPSRLELLEELRDYIKIEIRNYSINDILNDL